MEVAKRTGSASEPPALNPGPAAHKPCALRKSLDRSVPPPPPPRNTVIISPPSLGLGGIKRVHTCNVLTGAWYIEDTI